MGAIGEVNVYVCKDCRHYMATVNRAAGVTPYNIACRKCGSRPLKGGATSLIYPLEAVRRFGEPEYEWREPDAQGVMRLYPIPPAAPDRGPPMVDPTPPAPLNPCDMETTPPRL